MSILKSPLGKIINELEQFGIKPDLVQKNANEQIDSDLAMPCFALAKELRQNPNEIAQTIAAAIQHPAVVKAVAIAGYINIWLKPDAVMELIGQDLQSGDYGKLPSQNKKAVIEVGSLNMSKPFSVGHLRPTFHGAVLANLYKNLGYDVITDNHVGDWGTPFGKWVVGYLKYSTPEKLQADGIYELARVYVAISEDIKQAVADEAANIDTEVKDWLKKLESGDQQAVAYHQQFMHLSFEHMHKVLDRMNIQIDTELGESTYIDRGMKLVDELVASGQAIAQADGSVIIALDEFGIETPFLIKKSDGSALYATSDLATAEYRAKGLNADLVVIPTGAEQKFYFNQLCAAIEKIGLNLNLHHHWFGLIDQLNDDGTRSKISSRKGTVLMEELLDHAEARAKDLNPNAGPENHRIIALGALKFADLSQDPKINILFDWDKMFSLTGYCGPYVQYAAIRVKSVLAKSEVESAFDPSYDWQPEKALIMHLARYPEVTEVAATDFAPQKVAIYVYDLAKLWNKYYEGTRIMGSEHEPARLWLARQIYTNFEHALALLGIEVPSEM